MDSKLISEHARKISVIFYFWVHGISPIISSIGMIQFHKIDTIKISRTRRRMKVVRKMIYIITAIIDHTRGGKFTQTIDASIRSTIYRASICTVSFLQTSVIYRISHIMCSHFFSRVLRNIL